MTIRYSKTTTLAMAVIDAAAGYRSSLRTCGWCLAAVPARQKGGERVICLHCGRKRDVAPAD